MLKMSRNQLRVSVIIPVYNADKYIAEAIESVLDQNFSDFEVIVVNDGSTDRSGEICQHYGQLDKSVRYFEQENSGVSVARNLGLKYARGEYVFFLDSDDTIDLNFLRSSYQIAHEGGYDLVVLGEPYASRLPRPPALPTCAQFWRLSFLKGYPEIRFPEGIQPCEDGLFSHQLIALTDRIGFNPRAQYFYRQHDQQNHRVILSQSQRVLAQIPAWLNILQDFYSKKDLWNVGALHLALFMQHEPFELRYLFMPLSDEQKNWLFGEILKFAKEHIFPFLSPEDWMRLSPAFQRFLKSFNYREFDTWLSGEIARIEQKRKRSLWMLKFIPIPNWRRTRRININQYFDDMIRTINPLYFNLLIDKSS